MTLYEKNMMRHNEGLIPYACDDQKYFRFQEEKEDIRSPFFRDIDRVLYTLAFSRYNDKTQVYSKKDNDHITRRMQHAQYVSKIARTIGRALALNEDLIEAASLGHDLGHVPFGHFGESVLNEISLRYHEGYFYHNIESVRLLMEIEDHGDGKNLCVQVLDAIMCHNGEFVLGEYAPREKSPKEFLKEYEESYQDPNVVKKLIPMTLEGCVVRVSDIIAYLGKDIEDAYLLGRFQLEEIPKEISSVLGTKNREIVNTVVMDIIKNSIGKPYLKMSDEVYQAVIFLKKFNYQHIYDVSLSKKEKEEVRKKFTIVFETFLKDVKEKNRKSKIYTDFLNDMKEEYLLKNTPERITLDFIAGMTDGYFLRCYEACKKSYLGYTKERRI